MKTEKSSSISQSEKMAFFSLNQGLLDTFIKTPKKFFRVRSVFSVTRLVTSGQAESKANEQRRAIAEKEYLNF